MRKIHSIPAPEDAQTWDSKYRAYLDIWLADYPVWNERVSGGDLLMNYITENNARLRQRPQCLIHGDFLESNLILNGNGLFVIDWNNAELDTMIQYCKDVLRWHNNMQNPVPAWYATQF